MKRRHAWMVVRLAVFALAAFVLNFPLIATVVTSLKGEAEIGANPTLGIPGREECDLRSFVKRV